METAAQAAVHECTWIPDESSVLVVCGNGNNGGDGYVVARELARRCNIVIGAVPNLGAMSAATKVNFQRVLDLGIPITDPLTALSHNYDVVVDAILGVGGSASVREPQASWIRAINALHTKVVSIDVPTGLDPLSGEAHPDAVKAFLTITMEGYKPGLLTGTGKSLCGRIVVVPIGAPTEVTDQKAFASVIEQSDVRRLLPPRRHDSHKYSYGHVLVVAGSPGMRGAAALTAEAALRCGAGLVTLASDDIHPLLPREVMTVPLSKAHSIAERCTVIVAGPGLGTDSSRLTILTHLLSTHPDIPTVVDADALRILGDLRNTLQHMVITPHLGEFKRLLEQCGLPPCEPVNIMESVQCAVHLSRFLNCTVHLKTVPAITTNGNEMFICSTGTPALATAGTGDVLSGIIGGLLAQHVRGTPTAAALGAYVHGMAAEVALQTKAPEYLLAGDIIRELGSVLA